MKKIFLKIFTIAIILLISGTYSFAQIPDDILSGLKKGNAGMLSKYFNQNIEMAVLGEDDVYSKAQAQQIISSFFSQYKVESFSMIHETGKESSKYAIGNLKTDKETFRVSILLKSDNGNTYIHQLRIEKQ